MTRSRKIIMPGSCLTPVVVFSLMTPLFAQVAHEATPRDTLLHAAREIMEAAHICTLVTLDDSGQPHSRVMDPFEPGDDMVVWMGTTRNSRKVREISNDPRVNLFYLDAAGGSYVSISGIARLVDDVEEKNRYWKEAWTPFYSDREKDYVLIAVTPERMEVISYSRGIVGHPQSWSSPVVDF